jgi:hypothetical protein
MSLDFRSIRLSIDTFPFRRHIHSISFELSSGLIITTFKLDIEGFDPAGSVDVCHGPIT